MEDFPEKSQNPSGGIEEIFTDWSTYQNLEGIPEGVRYSPPQEREDIRSQLRNLPWNELAGEERIGIKTALSFLEGLMIQDNYGSNDKERDKAYLATKVTPTGQEGLRQNETNLYELAKYNKLRGNVISRVITAAMLLAEVNQNDSLKETADSCKKSCEQIKNDPGFFKPEDLAQFDNLALEIIRSICSNYGF